MASIAIKIPVGREHSSLSAAELSAAQGKRRQRCGKEPAGFELKSRCMRTHVCSHALSVRNFASGRVPCYRTQRHSVRVRSFAKLIVAHLDSMNMRLSRIIRYICKECVSFVLLTHCQRTSHSTCLTSALRLPDVCFL